MDGLTALITGAARGIGLAIAEKFAREGARLVLNDLDEAPLAAAARDISARGGIVETVPGDVAATDFGERIVGRCMQRFGALDVIVNNAGYTWDNVIQKMSDEQWHSILDVHLTAPFRILRAAQPVIKQLVAEERAAGRRVVRKVINVSSVAGLFGSVGQVNYAAAKAGVIGFTQSLAKEWGRYDVTVNCVAYALIDTRIAGDVADGETVSIDGRAIRVGINSELRARLEESIPLGRAGTPEEAAGAVFLFALPEADYISGQTLLCSGGLTGM